MSCPLRSTSSCTSSKPLSRRSSQQPSRPATTNTHGNPALTTDTSPARDAQATAPLPLL